MLNDNQLQCSIPLRQQIVPFHSIQNVGNVADNSIGSFLRNEAYSLRNQPRCPFDEIISDKRSLNLTATCILIELPIILRSALHLSDRPGYK